MSTQEVFVQQFARLFHHYQQALTPASEPPERQAESWRTVNADERNRMVAAARLAIQEIESNAHRENNSRKYFAKPGEAEWGC